MYLKPDTVSQCKKVIIFLVITILFSIIRLNPKVVSFFVEGNEFKPEGGKHS